MDSAAAKTDRILQIYSRLVNGDILSKKGLAQQFHVAERSVQRDIESLRCFFAEQGLSQDVVYDKNVKGYRLENPAMPILNNREIFAVCKILLESRSMCKDEMFPILDKLISLCVPESSKRVISELLANEKYHYVPPHHGKQILNLLWEIGQAVENHQVIEIEYERMKEPKMVKRRVQPVGLLFSEYYFYMTAFWNKINYIENSDVYPIIYRIDRIRSLYVLNEHFNVQYKDRFQEGEFRKRVQFMYGGKLTRIKFKYTGPSIEAVLDRLPTAVIREVTDGWIVTAEVLGKGIEMWLRSQGEYVEVWED